MKRIVAILVTILVSGCATEKAFNDRAILAVGKDINQVINVLGPPSSTFAMPNGNTVYSWQSQRSVAMPIYQTPTTTTISGFGNMAQATTQPGLIVGGGQQQFSCLLNFTTDKTQHIIAYSYRGNDCKAKPL